MSTVDWWQEWDVARFDPVEHRPVGGIALRQCPFCHALVLEDFAEAHQMWHDQQDRPS
jgi:hypothetical protein